MKTRTFFILLLLAGSGLLSAKEIPASLAKQVALSFMRQHFITDSLAPLISEEIELCYSKESQSVSVDRKEPARPLYYVFEYQLNPGFIVVAGDDGSYPILGYSTGTDFNPDSLNPAVRKWLENYSDQIRYIIQNELPSPPEVRQQWDALVNGQELKSLSSVQSAGPLCLTQWSQSPYYNQLCPYDNQARDRTVTGCVATAMAQIMKFWNHPAQGEGFHSYNHENYGTLSANFGGEKYNWTSMPNKVSTTNTSVASLMYHCGISVDMHYGVGSAGGSGAYVITAASPVQHCSEYALENYFGFDNSLEGVQRQSYTDQSWINLLKTELNADRPVLYAGFGSGGGHCFVCDGYNGEYFHMNWGWGGSYDGFFLISALNPSGVGTGGGTGGFNSGHQAVIGIKPAGGQTGETTGMVLYDQITVSTDPVLYGDGFTVHTNVANTGTTNFSGDFCVAIFDQDINFVDFAGILTGYSLSAGYYYTGGLDFTYSGSLTLLPGSYIMAAFCKTTDGNWVLLGDYNAFKNLATLTVKHENDLELYADISISVGSEIIQGMPFDVHLDVGNFGSTDFAGIMDVSLYTLEGDFAETIDAWEDIELYAGYHFSEGITFSTNGVDVEPGTYLLALLYNDSNQGWQLAGSTYHTNPIKVIVKAAPILPDPFETNNTRETAYLIQPAYRNNAARVITDGSNIHTGQDYDFYGIKLDAGYKYTVKGRVHDSYNSGDGLIYTNDVLVSLLVEDYTSDVFDDVMPTFTIIAHGNGIAYFYVAPYFTGQEGTYLLDVSITRVYGTGVETDPLAGNIIVWPNPASHDLNISWENDPVSRITIFNLEGQVLKDIHLSGQADRSRSIPVEDLVPGVYIVEIKADGKSVKHRFVKSSN